MPPGEKNVPVEVPEGVVPCNLLDVAVELVPVETLFAEFKELIVGNYVALQDYGHFLILKYPIDAGNYPSPKPQIRCLEVSIHSETDRKISRMISNLISGLAVVGIFRSITEDINLSRLARGDAVENSAKFMRTIVRKNENRSSLVWVHVSNATRGARWKVEP